MSKAIQWISVCKRKGVELTISLQRNIKLVLREDFIIVHAYKENISNILLTMTVIFQILRK